MKEQSKREYRFLYIIVILFFSIGFFTYCANPATPQGGPKDTIPPKIVIIEPSLLTKNFTSSTILIEFNEYIQVKNSQTEILISPEMEKRPRFTVKGKTVTVDLEGIKLDSATTYKIDFGMAIVDNNESNPLTNFSYVFSTGEVIDSLAMSGQVIDAFTGDSIFNAVVLLYDAQKDTLDADSVLYLSKPSSITRTDSMGVFIATNLKGIDYKVYAISEESSDGKYNKGSDKVSFCDTVLNPTTMPNFDVWYNPRRMRIEATPQMVYRLFSEPAIEKRQNLEKSSRPEKSKVILEFAAKNPLIEEIRLDSISLDDVVIDYTQFRDTITIYYPYKENFPDSLKGWVTYLSTTPDSLSRDTLIEKSFALSYFEPKKRARDNDDDKKEPNPFRMTTDAKQIINPYSDITFEFGLPLVMLDSTNIKLDKIIKEDEKEQRGARGSRGATQKSSETQNSKENEKREAVPFMFERDSINILKWRLKAKWEDSGEYELNIPDSTFVNNFNQKNDSIKSRFSAMNREEFGLIKLNIVTPSDSTSQDSTSYIVMLESKKTVEQQKIISRNGELIFEYVPAGEYSIKVIEDTNNDGVWSDGILTERIQPERTAIYREGKNRYLFEVKKNWEIEGITLDMSKLFPPTTGIINSNDANTDNDNIEINKQLPL